MLLTEILTYVNAIIIRKDVSPFPNKNTAIDMQMLFETKLERWKIVIHNSYLNSIF